jgi:hypothetical protein
MEQITISAKNLGAMALRSFCPRCFWIKMKCHNKVPFQIFPGIFSSIDSYSKRITDLHYSKLATVPKWFTSFGALSRPVKVPHYSKFLTEDTRTNIQLRGTPDEMVQMSDASYFIIDYKTAKYTGTQDELLPMYEIQLNAYAYIANRGNFRPVSGIGLVYYEPVTDLNADGFDEVLMENGFKMVFSSRLHTLRLDPETLIPPLLERTRRITDMPKLPAGTEGCADCRAVDELVHWATS